MTMYDVLLRFYRITINTALLLNDLGEATKYTTALNQTMWTICCRSGNHALLIEAA